MRDNGHAPTLQAGLVLGCSVIKPQPLSSNQKPAGATATAPPGLRGKGGQFESWETMMKYSSMETEPLGDGGSAESSHRGKVEPSILYRPVSGLGMLFVGGRLSSNMIHGSVLAEHLPQSEASLV